MPLCIMQIHAFCIIGDGGGDDDDDDDKADYKNNKDYHFTYCNDSHQQQQKQN